MTKNKRIIITPGEPAGIGPDIIIQLSKSSFSAEIVIISDPDLIIERAKNLNIPLELQNVSLDQKPTITPPGTLKIIPLKLKTKCEPGKLNKLNSDFVLESLYLACDICLNKKADALTTGPVQKSIINEAGYDFSGHTEFLAKKCNVSDVIMLFIIDNIRVALLTTHMPLMNVARSITKEKIIKTINLLNKELKNLFNIENPQISVTGLNPHAGENGHLGTEEIKIIQPALKILQSNKINVKGPIPADTLFTPNNLKNADAVLAMYHDQALPVVKYLGFNKAVNMTLGLPIIRTSVDHGTALDIAGTTKANSSSLKEAVSLAIKIAQNKN
ncbi:4-hydroxythreonine-4-phosphate dehydrogenase PdxA [Gammaproteobacteria bacterium]|nr:4-hydroxythreonine-4-phosphate dehydrogenase PdxA [Gammaproteobacteria bacterium]